MCLENFCHLFINNSSPVFEITVPSHTPACGWLAQDDKDFGTLHHSSVMLSQAKHPAKRRKAIL